MIQEQNQSLPNSLVINKYSKEDNIQASLKHKTKSLIDDEFIRIRNNIQKLIKQDIQTFKREIDAQFQQAYWDNHQNSSILSFSFQEYIQDEKEFSTFYERIDESFISKHSIQLDQRQRKPNIRELLPKRSRSPQLRLRSIMISTKKERRHKTEQEQQQPNKQNC